MELRQLNYFTKAAELLNFTEAAQALYISQSTLSQQIKQLEDELGIPLFNRIGKRIHLTEAGRLFLPYANQTLQDALSGREMLNDLMNLQTGSIAIGATYGLTQLLVKALQAFTTQYPHVQVHIQYGTTDALLEQLSASKLDMVLSFASSSPLESIAFETLFTSSLSLVVPTNHALARNKSITLKEAVTIPLILPVRSYSIRRFMDESFEKGKLQPDIRMDCNDVHTILEMIKGGNIGTILMKVSTHGYHTLKAIPLEGKNMQRKATIAWPADAYRKKSIEILAGLLKKNAEDIL
ncbi:transcriptional regulator, LysR family [Filimonas lacunae]|uniref:Transcriptional regulator, LysR family n=1 Tax=Filimonas lacunae TaxID=477680 RepID=A0A173MII9_9BACT|nr:LysR substrate-binding domain-containing protein [Filimonas lacunae]BAV07415.1 transcriptional regulator, LysR family [Filimonas lacunae]SIT30450.1 transcriptional regulator, LysR family [Filimonas lacunae]